MSQVISRIYHRLQLRDLVLYVLYHGRKSLSSQNRNAVIFNSKKRGHKGTPSSEGRIKLRSAECGVGHSNCKRLAGDWTARAGVLQLWQVCGQLGPTRVVLCCVKMQWGSCTRSGSAARASSRAGGTRLQVKVKVSGEYCAGAASACYWTASSVIGS